jgi:Tfp pilus assembly protein PilF
LIARAGAIEAARQAFAAGDLASAESRCRNLIAADPSDAWPWTMLGEIALRRGDGEAALGHARKAVALDPKLLLGHVMLAKCLLQRGDYVEALAAAEAAATIASAPAVALDGLGAIFGLLGKHDKAQRLFRRATAAAPGMPQFEFNLAASERMLGRFGEAEARCDRLLGTAPDLSLLHALRADLRTQTLERNHIAELEALVAKGGQDEITLRFALAKEYEDIGDDRAAFRHIRAGAALHRRRLGPYTVAGDVAVVERVMRTQTAPWLTAVPRGTESAAPIFVAGLPRSGTTVVERIIASHSAVASAGETGVFPREMARAFGAARQRPGGVPDLESLGRRYVATTTGFAVPPGRRFVDKTLQNYLYCGLIHAALPNAQILLVRRHPLDTCFALFKTHFAGTFPFSYALEDLAEYYLAFHRLAAHWRAVLPPHAFREVRYEAVVEDFEAECRGVLDFVGLPWEDAVRHFHESAAPSATASAVQVRQPLYTTSVGRWRRHAADLEPLRARLAQVLPDAELA